jgi:malonyl-CoA O-methyltransferase
MFVRPTKQCVRASFDRAAPSYDAAASLQRQVCEKLLAGFAAESVNVPNNAPGNTQPSTAADILDAGCGTGYASRLLRQRWPSARITAADFAPAMLSLARQEADFCLAADIEALPFAANSFDTWWSNLTLQWCTARNVFDEAARVLRHGGRLAVSTLAPGTFHELRTAFSVIDPYRHTLAFSTPDEIGAALAAAGFHRIALSRETLNVYYPDLKTLLRAVKAIGANRIGSGRRKGMMGRTAWQAVEAAYECQRTSAGLPASYDVIFCYAKKNKGCV